MLFKVIPPLVILGYYTLVYFRLFHPKKITLFLLFHHMLI
jgi:hypothetical protein